jgi:hypothetical protein
MQFFGHTWRHTPQASQTLSSTAKDLPPCTLYVFFVVAGLSTANSSALTGQATTQLLHPVQLLSMCNANVTYFTSLIVGKTTFKIFERFNIKSFLFDSFIEAISIAFRTSNYIIYAYWKRLKYSFQ